MINPKVFVSRKIFPEALDLLSQVAEVDVWPEELPPNPQELGNKIANADGLLTTIMDRIDASILDRAPRLKVISQLAVGLDNVDVEEASRRGILVGFTPGILSKATADVGFALLCPLGALVFYLGTGNEHASHQVVVGLAFGAAAGVFLCIATPTYVVDCANATQQRCT